MTYVIKYSSSRFPEQQKREDGTWGCRGCGGPLPKRRYSWCSNPCAERFDPRFVIPAVKKRDNGICQACGFDTRHKDPANGTRRDPEYDHIVPFSEGGLTVLENLRTLCRPCHKTRTKEWHAERAAARRPQRSLLTGEVSA